MIALRSIDKVSMLWIICRPGDPEPCTVSATQQATEVKPIFQNHQNTNLNEAKSEEPKVKTTTTTATTKSTTTTTTTTTTPKPTTSLTTKPTKLPTPTPPENGNLGSDGSSVQTDEDLSPSDESNGNMENKMNIILDIIKKGSMP